MSPENKALIERFSHGRITSWAETNPTTFDTFINAVRAEERARAVEVVKPFAEEAEAFEAFADSHVPQGASYAVGDFRRAAAYVTDNQGEA